MKGTLYISKSKNMFTISPARIRASISFQVSYPAADSLETHPFVFVQDTSHKATILMLEDIRATAEFYALLEDIVTAIQGNLVAEENLEKFLVGNLGMTVKRK